MSAEPSEEDKAICSKPSIDRSVKIDELVRLLHVFKAHPNVRTMKVNDVYVDKVVMAIRGCSSVIKVRQDAAIAAGVAAPMVEVLGGIHADDRETCLRTCQCVLGICGKNDEAIAAFAEAGAAAVLEPIVAKHKDSNSKDMAKALALFPAVEASAEAPEPAAAAAPPAARVSFPGEDVPSEEGVPPPLDGSELRARTASTIQRTTFLTGAGLDHLVTDGGHRSEPLTQDKVFRYDVVTGVWSLHLPLPKPGSGKPRGYASRSLDTRTHERPERTPPGSFDPFDLDNRHLTPPASLEVPDPADASVPMIRVFANKFPVLDPPPAAADDDDAEMNGLEVAFVDSLFPQVSGIGNHEVVVQHWKLNMCQALMTPTEVQVLWSALHTRFKHLQTVRKTAVLERFLMQNRSFCQHRLGTNISRQLKKDPFPAELSRSVRAAPREPRASQRRLAAPPALAAAWATDRTQRAGAAILR
jgi:hypothetical protein